MSEGTQMPPVTDLPELPSDEQLVKTVRDLINFARESGCEINPSEGMDAGGGEIQPERP